mmetsp:Transcript_25136/g.72434  ORF Transcript_25136/g.72434 Transcript_25136/m.72434 type:complete len:262 (+) Transcript_25136:708-1493(+)
MAALHVAVQFVWRLAPAGGHVAGRGPDLLVVHFADKVAHVQRVATSPADLAEHLHSIARRGLRHQGAGCRQRRVGGLPPVHAVRAAGAKEVALRKHLAAPPQPRAQLALLVAPVLVLPLAAEVQGRDAALELAPGAGQLEAVVRVPVQVLLGHAEKLDEAARPSGRYARCKLPGLHQLPEFAVPVPHLGVLHAPRLSDLRAVLRCSASHQLLEKCEGRRPHLDVLHEGVLARVQVAVYPVHGQLHVERGRSCCTESNSIIA